jgi:hypothetical protein
MANAAIAGVDSEELGTMANAAIAGAECGPIDLEDSFYSQEQLDRVFDSGFNRIQRVRFSFIFNIAVKKIKNPMDSLLFCFLWYRLEETKSSQIKITLNELSEAIGASKRGIQDSIKRLTELGLINNINAGTTFVPILKLHFGFKK